MKYDISDISFFVHCGYLPRYEKSSLWNYLPKYIKSNNSYFNGSETEDEEILIDNGINALRSCFDNVSGELHIIPLSGGLDSRAILAGLIDVGYRDKIVTVSFGTPGLYDYEICKIVSKKFGVQYKNINLESIIVSTENLIETASNGAAWTFLIDAYYNSLICKEFGKEATYWSGFMGGEYAGSHLPLHESSSWEKAKKYFINCNDIVHTVNLTKPGINSVDCLPEAPLINQSIISYDDQLDFAFRQHNYIKNVVTFNGYKYITPFLNSEWVSYILSLPRKYRVNKYIYKKILLKAFPSYYKLPTENNYGASLNASINIIKARHLLNAIRKRMDNHSNINRNYLYYLWNYINIYESGNYINFNNAIRQREDYYELVSKNIRELKKRKLLEWIDVEAVFNSHMSNRANHSSALMVLTALEISLKVGE